MRQPSRLVAASLLALLPGLAWAEEASTPAGIWTQDSLLGDGFPRARLGDLGIGFGLQDTNEVLGNPAGGARRGASYDGLTMLSLGLDTAKAGGWEGGIFNVSFFNIRGRNIANDNLLSLQTPSGILAQPTTRLWEAWYQQSFAGGAADFKIGQFSVDTEFMASASSGVFMNTMAGWPMTPSADLYAGGPAYPLGAVGARLRVRPNDAMTLLAAMVDDNPPGGAFAVDSQLLGAERTGTRFNLGGGALIFAEAQYAVNQPDPDARDAAPGGLPAIYKLGFWVDTGRFPSPQVDAAGLSLANPKAGAPRLLGGNASLYAIIDQTVWQDGSQALSLFARVMGAPGDRNLVDFSINGGAVLKAPFAGRDNDSAGIGFGVAHVGAAAQARDAAARAYDPLIPVRGSETYLELTYQYLLAPWWTLQPDAQFVFNPGGGLLNPLNPKQKIGDETIAGLRSVITF